MYKNHLYPGGENFLGDEIRSSHFSSEKLSCSVFPRAVILPYKSLSDGNTGGGVVSAEGEYLPSSGVHYGFCSPYEYNGSDIEEKDEDVIYLGMFNGAWGHCLTDNIRRLWYLNTEEFRENHSECRIVYTALDTFRFSDSFIMLLKILGIEADELVKIERVSCYRNIIIPDEAFFADADGFRYYTKQYLDMIERIKCYASTIEAPEEIPAAIDRIFLSYSQYTKGKTCGEEMLAEYFLQNGFTVIAPEKYSFDSQLYIYTHCSVMASTVGSCSHNSIFMREGSELILIPRSYYLTGYQAALNEINRIKVCLVDSSLSDRVNSNYPWGGPFCFFVSHELEDVFGNQYCASHKKEKNVAVKTLKNYFLTALQCERMFNPEEIDPPKYYEQAVQAYIGKMFSDIGLSQKTSGIIVKVLHFINSAVIAVKSVLHR